jgi:hypothetical protein
MIEKIYPRLDLCFAVALNLFSFVGGGVSVVWLY